MSGLQLSHDKLIEVYRTMRMIRRFEERVMDEMATGDVPGNTHLYAGQEASAVGVCLHLNDDDYISSTHRGHGHSIAKGVEIDGMMAELFGRATGTCGGKGGSQHIADLRKGMLGANGIVAAGAPITCGAALSAKLQGTNQVAVAFAGDGAMNEGVMSESFNLAKIWNLPIIFAIEDNGFGEATANAHVRPAASRVVPRAMTFQPSRSMVRMCLRFMPRLARLWSALARVVVQRCYTSTCRATMATTAVIQTTIAHRKRKRRCVRNKIAWSTSASASRKCRCWILPNSMLLIRRSKPKLTMPSLPRVLHRSRGCRP